ncbi:MAG: alpha/beta fold hydrolase [Cyclobacteriaceae bacterium]
MKKHLRVVRYPVSILLFFWLSTVSTARDAKSVVKEVRFRTDDNVEIRGSYYTHDQSGPGILLMHQCMEGSDRNSWASVANKLAEEGYHVLAFDFRGYGDSDGQWPDFEKMSEFISVCRSTISRDVNAAFEFLKSQPNVNSDQIGVGGASCGVFMGIDLAASNPEIKTMVLFSGPFDIIAREKLNQMDSVPVLTSASVKDTRAFEAMKRLFSATNNPNSIFIQLKGDRHGTFMFDIDPDLENKVTAWFQRWL